MATETTIHAHNSQHFENLQLSAKEFYTMLKTMVNEYQYPGVKCEPETLSEGGLFSSKREYLRISMGRYNFYVCASPFGKSFFISWWIKENANATAAWASKFGLFGKRIAQSLESKSFFEVDTETMFTSSINALIVAAIEKMKQDKGYRPNALAIAK